MATRLKIGIIGLGSMGSTHLDIYSKKINTDCIEIHTGKISNLIKMKKNFQKELKKIKKAVIYANSLGLEVHAGHGMDYKTTKILNQIKQIEEFKSDEKLVPGQWKEINIRNLISKFLVYFSNFVIGLE